MRRPIAGEFGKLFTTRLWLWLLLASMALTALYASLAIAFDDDPDNFAPSLNSPAGQRLLFAVAGGAAKSLVAVLAAIGLTGEFRHKTVTATFLATPHRGRVVAAKLVTYAVVGAGYGLVCIGVIATVAVFAVLGVGLGALLRDQVATVVALLIYLFVAEPIITRISALGDWTRYLPGPAASALTQVTLDNQAFLHPWQGGLVLAV